MKTKLTPLVAICSLLTASLYAQTSAPPALTLFQNVRIFDGKSAALSAPANVLVRGNVIEKISAQPIPTDKRGDTKIIDGGGRTLMPGLIDNHVHIFLGASSQMELLNPKATFETLEARAAKEAELMLLRGFTSARDMGGPVFGIKKNIDQGKGIGPRLLDSYFGHALTAAMLPTAK